LGGFELKSEFSMGKLQHGFCMANSVLLTLALDLGLFEI
jgi:hypothetical protein